MEVCQVEVRKQIMYLLLGMEKYFRTGEQQKRRIYTMEVGMQILNDLKSPTQILTFHDSKMALDTTDLTVSTPRLLWL